MSLYNKTGFIYYGIMNEFKACIVITATKELMITSYYKPVISLAVYYFIKAVSMFNSIVA